VLRHSAAKKCCWLIFGCGACASARSAVLVCRHDQKVGNTAATLGVQHRQLLAKCLLLCASEDEQLGSSAGPGGV
jgi:hypothetical protein